MADNDDLFGVDDLSKKTEAVTKTSEGMSASLDEATKASKEMGRALSESAANIQRYSQTIVPAADKTQNFGRRAKRAAEEAQTLNDKLKESWQQLKKYTDETFGATHATNTMKQAATGAVVEFKKLTNVTAQYNRHLKVLREGQELYTRSLLYHTGMQEKASKGLQKSVNLVWQQYKITNELMDEFYISSDEGMKIQEAARKQFITQIQAYKDSRGVLKDLSRDALLLTRRLGMDLPKFMAYTDERMRRTNRTLKEAQNETMLVAKAYDTYLKELRKTPGELEKANLKAQDWMATMQEASEAMKFGALNTGAFAAALVPLQKIGREAGLNVEEIKSMNSGVVKLLTTLQSTQLKNIFGVQSAHDIMNRIDEFAAAGDERVKRRLKFVSEGIKKGTLNEIQAMREVLQAAKGDPRLMAMVLKRFSDLPTQLRNEIIQGNAELQKNPIAARILAEQLGPGSGFMNKMEEFAGDDKAANEAANKYREEQAELAKKALTPTEKTFLFTAKIAKWTDQIINWLKENIYITLAAAGASLIALARARWKEYSALIRIERAIYSSGGIGGRGGGLPGGAGRGARRGTYASRRAATAASAARSGMPLTPAGAAATPGGGRFGRYGGMAVRGGGMAMGAAGMMGLMGQQGRDDMTANLALLSGNVYAMVAAGIYKGLGAINDALVSKKEQLAYRAGPASEKSWWEDFVVRRKSKSDVELSSQIAKLRAAQRKKNTEEKTKKGPPEKTAPEKKTSKSPLQQRLERAQKKADEAVIVKEGAKKEAEEKQKQVMAAMGAGTLGDIAKQAREQVTGTQGALSKRLDELSARRAEGRLTDVQAYKELMQQARGTPLAVQLIGELAQGKETQRAQEAAATALNLKIEGTGEGGEGLAQEGKLNSVSGTMEYNLPAQKLVFSIANLVKGIDQTRADNPPITNTSKTG